MFCVSNLNYILIITYSNAKVNTFYWISSSLPQTTKPYKKSGGENATTNLTMWNHPLWFIEGCVATYGYSPFCTCIRVGSMFLLVWYTYKTRLWFGRPYQFGNWQCESHSLWFHGGLVLPYDTLSRVCYPTFLTSVGGVLYAHSLTKSCLLSNL